MTPLSDSEARTVARFENAEPAPESWDGGLREALAEESRAHRWGAGLAVDGHSIWRCMCGERPDDMDAHRADSLLAFVTAYAERVARERAAEELRNVAGGIGGGAKIAGLPMPVKQALGIAAGVVYVRADELTADDRTGQR